jgi:hypothetical protein
MPDSIFLPWVLVDIYRFSGRLHTKMDFRWLSDDVIPPCRSPAETQGVCKLDMYVPVRCGPKTNAVANAYIITHDFLRRRARLCSRSYFRPDQMLHIFTSVRNGGGARDTCARCAANPPRTTGYIVNIPGDSRAISSVLFFPIYTSRAWQSRGFQSSIGWFMHTHKKAPLHAQKGKLAQFHFFSGRKF